MDLSGAPILTRNEKAVMRYAGRKGVLAERFPVSGPQNGGAAHAGHGNWQPNGKSAMHHRLRQSGESFSSFEDGLLTRKEQRDEHVTAIAATIHVPYNPNAQLPAHAQSSPSDASFSLGGSAVWVNEETANGEGGDNDSVASGTAVAAPSRKRRSVDASPGPSHLKPPLGHQGSHTCFGVGKDAYFYHTTVVHNDHQLPRKMPLSTFPDDVGEDFLITVIKALASTTQVSGPAHPHLHTSSPQTHLIIILFNALVIGKRIIFSGYEKPAREVFSFVLSGLLARWVRAARRRCAGSLSAHSRTPTWRTRRNRKSCTPAYIPGAIKPIFKPSPTSDVRLDISVGATIAGEGHMHHLLSRDASVPGSSTSGDVQYGSKSNFPRNIRATIEYYLGETHVRMRSTEYVHRFVRLALRYEEDAYGLIKFGYPSLKSMHCVEESR
ncbi:hypothetical protein MKEN_00625300 [Mycena kentingensis (nom. inval.)]|nr:hypothetical protein MKEN_00625300 [Mycena kentingensis (nom. inval.)]